MHDTVHHHTLATVALSNPLQLWHFLDAWATPSRPEVQHDDAALVITDPNHLVIRLILGRNHTSQLGERRRAPRLWESRCSSGRLPVLADILDDGEFECGRIATHPSSFDCAYLAKHSAGARCFKDMFSDLVCDGCAC